MFVTAIISTLFCLLAAVVVFILVKRPSAKVRQLVDQIPGPTPVPIFGNALQFKTNGAAFYRQIIDFCNQYGKETGILRAWLGFHLVTLVCTAETAEVLLKSSKHITKSMFYSFIEPWLNTGLLISTGQKWHSRRKLITPSFHFKILEDFLQVFNEQTAVLQARLETVLGQKKSADIDISSYITLCALDIICDSAMGQHVDAQANSDSEYVRAIYKISELILQRVKSPWLWPDTIYYLTPAGRLHNRLLKTLHGFTNKVIRERQAEFSKQLKSQQQDISGLTSDEKPAAFGTRKRLAFLDMLLYSAESANLGPEDIREEVDTFMFEGHDTTSVASNWATFLIGAHEHVQIKVHQELDEIFGNSNRPVTMDDIKKLKYLECTIKEALRLYPSVPFIAREIAEDCNIGGFFVPKGSSTVIMMSVIHKDPRYFPDPEKFDPDRWLAANSPETRHPFAYIPFSAGLRNCIGQKFAMIEEKVILSSILRRFKVTSLQSRDEIVEDGELILRSHNGIKVRLQRRSE